MAKTSMKVKQQRPQKYKVREYTRCERCGRPHSVIRKFKIRGSKFCKVQTLQNLLPRISL